MSQLMEEILSRENMTLAYKKVKANKGTSGVDGISVDEIQEYLKENWVSIKEGIQKRKYKPQYHYQAVVRATGLNKISKKILAKRGLISCVDYYLN